MNNYLLGAYFASNLMVLWVMVSVKWKLDVLFDVFIEAAKDEEMHNKKQ